MMACRGSKSIAPPFLDLGTKWRQVVNFTPLLFYPRETTPVPIKQEAGRAPQPVWTFWRRKKLLLQKGIRTPDLPAPNISLISIAAKNVSNKRC
jgi:hypothetical protein